MYSESDEREEGGKNGDMSLIINISTYADKSQ
jgi:hypothetical protein